MTGLGLLTTEDEDCSWSSDVEAATEAATALSAPILASLEERLPPPPESREGGRASRKMESRRPREVVVESEMRQSEIIHGIFFKKKVIIFFSFHVLNENWQV